MSDFSEDLRYAYPLNADSVVVDLGCFEGTFAAKIHEMYGCRVFSFEPVPSFYDRCFLRFARNSKIVVMNLAVGNRDGEVTGCIRGDSSGIFAKDGEEWKARMVPMSTVMQMLGLKKVDLLKINVEGSEFDILENLTAQPLIGLIENIQVQWHDVVPNAIERYKDLQAALSKTHHLTFDHGWVWQNWKINPA